MSLDKSLLYHFVRDAIRPYSEAFSLISNTNPSQVILNEALYSIHLSYVHDSGNHRDNDDEVRIQISRALIEEQRRRQREGRQAAFIGFFDDGKTFVAWDPRHVFSLQAKTVVSVYARQSQRNRVATQAAAVHQFAAKFLGQDSFAIALPSDALGFYLENIEHFHRMKTEKGIQSLIKDNAAVFSDQMHGKTGTIEQEEGGDRERFTYTRTGFLRDPKFSRNVLEAYQRTCCICDRQLALVQAAHIIPHSEPECPNTVSNGLALCIEHHRLYDDALLLPGPDRRLVFNESRAEFLRQTNQARGLDEIAAQGGTTYRGPERDEHAPSNEYLQKGLEVRLGG